METTRRRRSHGVADGDLVIIETKYGQVEQTARLTDNLMQGLSVRPMAGVSRGRPGVPVRLALGQFHMLTSVGKLGKGTARRTSRACLAGSAEGLAERGQINSCLQRKICSLFHAP